MLYWVICWPQENSLILTSTFSYPNSEDAYYKKIGPHSCTYDQMQNASNLPRQLSRPLRISFVTPVTMSGASWVSSVTPVTMSGPLRISFVTPVTMSGDSSVSESIEWRDCPTQGPTSGWGSLWESFSFVPWFITFVFRNVPGRVLECVRICGFKRNSSSLDRAHKMRDSVLLNSWDNFSVILSSISSETCVIYSSLIPGTDVFRDWPFLGCPLVFLL